MLGEDVISVSGSDAHGTPIIIAADEEGITPEKFVKRKNDAFVTILKQWNIDLDNYTTTTTKHHKEFVRNFYADLYANNRIEEKQSLQHFCNTCKRFLPDRFVIGICPECNTDQARGDQCSNDACNTPLTPAEIEEPICSQCHERPVLRETTHWYFKLQQFEDEVLDYLDSDIVIPDSFQSEAKAFVSRGLQHRALTRDLDWGIHAADLFGSEEDKVFYVWAEDVLGYLSASAEVLEAQGRDWKQIWKDANTVYCLGKDNLFYHAIWLPALLQASSDEYSLPDVLSITNFLQFNGKGFSKSKGIGLWVDEALELAPADYWRFYLIYSLPNKRDSNFTWDNFTTTINKHLVNTVGNLVRRTCIIINQFRHGKVHQRKPSEKINQKFVDEIDEIEQELIEDIYACDLKQITHHAIDLARRINLHIEETTPWQCEDEEYLDEVLYLIYWSITRLSVWLQPLTPALATDIRRQLGIEEIEYSNLDLDTFNPPSSLPEVTFFLDKIDLEELKSKYREIKMKNYISPQPKSISDT